MRHILSLAIGVTHDASSLAFVSSVDYGCNIVCTRCWN